MKFSESRFKYAAIKAIMFILSSGVNKLRIETAIAHIEFT